MAPFLNDNSSLFPLDPSLIHDNKRTDVGSDLIDVIGQSVDRDHDNILNNRSEIFPTLGVPVSGVFHTVDFVLNEDGEIHNVTESNLSDVHFQLDFVSQLLKLVDENRIDYPMF